MYEKFALVRAWLLADCESLLLLLLLLLLQNLYGELQLVVELGNKLIVSKGFSHLHYTDDRSIHLVLTVLEHSLCGADILFLLQQQQGSTTTHTTTTTNTTTGY